MQKESYTPDLKFFEPTSFNYYSETCGNKQGKTAKQNCYKTEVKNQCLADWPRIDRLVVDKRSLIEQENYPVTNWNKFITGAIDQIGYDWALFTTQTVDVSTVAPLAMKMFVQIPALVAKHLAEVPPELKLIR